jgi:signal transduction histidine kinase
VQGFLVAQQGAEQVASPGYQTQAAAPRRISSSRPAEQIEPQQLQQLSQMVGAQSAYPQAGSVQPAFPAQMELTQQMQPSLQRDLAQQSRKGSMNNDQTAKNTVEYLMRSRAAQSYSRDNAGANNFMNVAANGDCSTCPVVAEGVLKPMWVSGALLLARRVSAGGEDYVQGCWLNWPAIRDSLLEDVADLLPNARLEPAVPASDARHERMLAALPVRLIPGAVPVELDDAGNPLHWSLAVAWACVMLAGLAVAVLLRGAIVLSERRGAFVSAVTHELRTPLTTLRMYTEMLADGMVRDDEKRRSYFQTLRAEADRLGHLVENVLAYSRIERGRARGQIVTLSIGALIARVRERLGERAQQAGMELTVEPNGAEQVDVRADPSAVEQILFNLVDNACKYAVCGPQPLIHLEATRVNGQAILCVRDHGPGIQQQETRRLFRPFSKSARDAANSAPGVGLGLALSRRLAREMGGDLRLDSTQNGGACFLLFLPVGHAES